MQQITESLKFKPACELTRASELVIDYLPLNVIEVTDDEDYEGRTIEIGNGAISVMSVTGGEEFPCLDEDFEKVDKQTREFAAYVVEAVNNHDRFILELTLTDKLLTARNRALMSIPECPVHGPMCLPHIENWIAAAKILMSRAEHVLSEHAPPPPS